MLQCLGTEVTETVIGCCSYDDAHLEVLKAARTCKCSVRDESVKGDSE